jgi:imidazolonepropionase-like amidohydrolase
MGNSSAVRVFETEYNPPMCQAYVMRAWIPFLVLLGLGGQEALAQTNAEPAGSDDAPVIAFANVAVLSMQDEVLLEDQTVVIRGDRILSIGRVDTASVPAGATVIDGSGRYLIPGLVDMHVHIRAPFADGPLYLNAGVTTVLALGLDAESPQKALAERERSRTPAFMGPGFYAAGPHIWGGETPDEVERIVRENAEGGFDIVKVHGDVSAESFDRLHEIARQLGMKVIGHAQHKRGMQPVYEHQQDLAHLDEYLDAEFNPKNPALLVALNVGRLGIVLLSLVSIGWWLTALGRRLTRRGSSGRPPESAPVRRWFTVFTGIAWCFFFATELTVTDPSPGLFAGHTVAIVLVGVLALLVISVAVLLSSKVRIAWREVSGAFEKRAALIVVVGLVWVFVVCYGYVAPRSWRTTHGAMERMARETAAAGIWVNPTLVVNDYFERNTSDEFYELIQRPEMRYVRPEMRDLWVNHNVVRGFPDAIGPVQLAIKKNYNVLLFRLLRELHEAKVPLLAGTDAVGKNTPGVFPGSALHEELALFVQAGLSPYEALRTATVNPAIYLEAEQEFGKVATGFRADLVLLGSNPLENVHHTRTRVGVMKRGRWFPADELETALERLAEDRK